MSTVGASKLHRFHHDNVADAAQEIVDAVGDLSGIEIWGSQIMLGVYCQPAVTKSGLRIGGKTQLEDVYQGSVGLILKMGPNAFADAKPELYGGRVPTVGDWVYHRAQDAVQMSVCGPNSKKLKVRAPDGNTEDAREWDGWPCRMVYAADLYGRVALPHVVK